MKKCIPYNFHIWNFIIYILLTETEIMFLIGIISYHRYYMQFKEIYINLRKSI